jgi:Ca2+-binding RTX toxin-like protein
MESLENRTVLSLAVHSWVPVSGAEQIHDGSGEKLSSPPVYLIFWGSYWQSATSGPTVAKVQNDTSEIFASPYLSYLTQHGVDGKASLAGSVLDPTNPGAQVTDGEIESEVNYAIDHLGLPHPGDASHQPIYVVLTPPGVSDSSQPTAGGYHKWLPSHEFLDSDTNIDDDDVVYAWVGNNGTEADLTTILSHELVESITDPGTGDGITATGGLGVPGSSSFEIADAEPNASNYTALADHVVTVQAYWSRNDGKFVVPMFVFYSLTGQDENDVEFDANFLPGQNHLIVLGQDASGNPQLTVDGTQEPLGSGPISSLIIKLGGLANTVRLDALSAGVNYTIEGLTGTNTLVAPAGPNIWQITGVDSGTLDGQVQFSSVQNLAGGPGPDQFQFESAGYISGNIDGGDGANTLDDSELTGPVTVDLQTSTATSIGGTFSNISSFVGSQGSDTLVGLDSPSVWTISGPNSGSVGGTTFSSFENLAGGTAADSFAFQAGGSVAGSIDGGGGSNTLDYSALTYSPPAMSAPPSDLIVNLALGTATAVGQGIQNIQNVTGGGGNDLIVGDGQANVLVGGAGRGIIIGGAGADQITGGGGDTILIAGTTAYDTDPTALSALMAEWTRTDRSVVQRIADLTTGGDGALNGHYTLSTKTVFNDGASDILTGGSGLDWFFFARPDDTVKNRKPGDYVMLLT